MNSIRSIVAGLCLLAAVVAAPASAGSQVPTGDSAVSDSSAAEMPTERVKRIGTRRLETVYVTMGAVDPQGKRWDDSGATIGTLPVVSESAFLEGDDATPSGSRP